MNKRALKMQNEMLVKQVASLSSQIEGYKKRMEEYSLLLQARDFEINRLNAELQSVQNGQTVPQEQPPVVCAANENIPQEILEQPAQTLPQEIVKETPTVSADYTNITAGDLLDNRQKLAAETIAAITLKAAALDAFLQKSNDPNAKELQAMVLGKTELFKSQVFAVVKGGVDGAGFVASLETLKSQMVEYFENIKMQLG